MSCFDCPICGKGQGEALLPDVDGYAIIRCKCCGLGVTQPIPDADELDGIRSRIYGAPAHAAMVAELEEHLRGRAVLRLGEIEGLTGGPGRLLDVGCGRGAFLDEARKRGWEALGVEPDTTSAEASRELGVEVIHSRLEEVGLPSGSFDAVTLWDVLEHNERPLELLTRIRTLLRPEGVLAAQSPNLESRMFRHAGAKWDWLSPPDHLLHFTPGSLSLLLEKSGFDTASITTWEPPSCYTEVLCDLFPMKRIPKRCRCLLLGPIEWLGRRRRWRTGQGGLVLAYAKRPRG